MDAADEFSNIVDMYDAMRADLAELRHETRRELDVISTRLDNTVTKAELAELRGQMLTQFQAVHADLQANAAYLQTELRSQTRWALGGVITVLLAILFSR